MSKSSTSENSRSCVIAIFTLVAIASLIALFFILKKSMSAEKELISMAMIPIIMGIIFELRRLQVSWSNIIVKLIISLGASLILSFIPGKKERVYNVEGHISYFPFVFIATFLIVSIIFFTENKEKDKLTAPLNEGILFVQSLSILYLLVDFINFGKLNFFAISFFLMGLAFAGISTFYAFTQFKQTSKSKFLLSFWSSIIMLIFGVYYGIRVFESNISTELSSTQNFLSFIQYFLFGTSAIYIVRNFYFIFGFLPLKNESKTDYKKRKDELNKIHIDRFSENQLHILSSIFCLVFVGSAYFLNFKFKWIPSYTMIWLVFTIFPFVIYFWERFTIKNQKPTKS